MTISISFVLLYFLYSNLYADNNHNENDLKQPARQQFPIQQCSARDINVRANDGLKRKYKSKGNFRCICFSFTLHFTTPTNECIAEKNLGPWKWETVRCVYIYKYNKWDGNDVETRPETLSVNVFFLREKKLFSWGMFLYCFWKDLT